MKIRAAAEADRAAIWKIFNEVVAAGDTGYFAFNERLVGRMKTAAASNIQAYLQEDHE